MSDFKEVWRWWDRGIKQAESGLRATPATSQDERMIRLEGGPGLEGLNAAFVWQSLQTKNHALQSCVSWKATLSSFFPSRHRPGAFSRHRRRDVRPGSVSDLRRRSGQGFQSPKKALVSWCQSAHPDSREVRASEGVAGGFRLGSGELVPV